MPIPRMLKSQDALIRKTSLLRDRPDCARGQAAQAKRRSRFRRGTPFTEHATTDERQGAWSTRTAFDLRRTRPRSDLLFTMSDNTHPPQHAAGYEFLFPSGRATELMVKNYAATLNREHDQQRRSRRHHKHNLTPIWWSQTGSNRRPPACKAGALPAELWPLRKRTIPLSGNRHLMLRTASIGLDWWAWEDLNFRPHAYQARALTN
jgi:hypothetical protein